MNAPEIWQQVPSVDGILASTLGRVMIDPYEGRMPHGGVRRYGGIAKLGNWDGTRYIFHWNKVGKTYRVARLVCEAFNGLPPFPGAVCMHIDENSRNNKPGNLRWGTQKENLNASGFIRYCKSRLGENSPSVKGRAKDCRKRALGSEAKIPNSHLAPLLPASGKLI